MFVVDKHVANCKRTEPNKESPSPIKARCYCILDFTHFVCCSAFASSVPSPQLVDQGLTTPVPFASIYWTYSQLEVVWKSVRLGLLLFGSPEFPFLRFISTSAGASWPSAEVFVMCPSATFWPRHRPCKAMQQLAFVAACSLTSTDKIKGCPLNKLATDSRLHEK